MDSVINLLVNFAQGNPGVVILASLVLRAVILVFLFSVSYLIWFPLLKSRGLLPILITSSIVVFISIPITISFVKPAEEGLRKIYTDIH